MPSSLSLQVVAAENFRMVSQDLKKHDKEMKRELYRGINRSLKPLKKAVKAEVPKRMPSGYAPVLSKSLRLRSNIRSSSKAASITITATAKGKVENRDVKALDAGRLRHPVFGNREVWKVQKIKPGFFTDPLTENVDVVRDEIVNAVNQANQTLTRG